MTFQLADDKTFEVPTKTTVPVPEGLVALLWGSRRIEDLEAALDMAPTEEIQGTLKTSLENVSTQFGLSSRVMSLVAVVKREDDQAGVEMDQKRVAVGTPEGMDPEGAFGGAQCNYLSMAAPACAAPAAESWDSGQGMLRTFSLCDTSQTLSSSGGSSRSFSGHRGLKRFRSSSRVGASSGGRRSKGLVLEKSSAKLFDVDPAKGASDARGIGYGDTLDYAPPGVTTGQGMFKSASPMDLLYQMEADGGLPGDNMEARIVRTLLVMLAIVSNEAKQTNPVDIYGAHFQRMWSFVRANLGEVSDGGYQKSIRALLKRLSPTKGWAGHKGEWLSIYATTDDDALDTAWQAILLAR